MWNRPIALESVGKTYRLRFASKLRDGNYAPDWFTSFVPASEVDMDSYAAARVAGTLRSALVEQGESFVFETVFSDPVGDKLAFLKDAAARGYTVILCFIGISGSEVSEQRVAMRVSQGGHDVPSEKIIARYPRTLANLQSAIRELPHVWIFDNDDLRKPYRKMAVFEHDRRIFVGEPVPEWLRHEGSEAQGV